MGLCDLCHREKDLPISFYPKLDSIEYKFDEDMCNICNLYAQITGHKKPVCDYDIKKMEWFIFITNKAIIYYEDERRIQQTDNIVIWKNDKYIKDWYQDRFGNLGQIYSFKVIMKEWFANNNKTNNKQQLTINLNVKKYFNKWLLDNYYHLKNKARWQNL